MHVSVRKTIVDIRDLTLKDGVESAMEDSLFYTAMPNYVIYSLFSLNNNRHKYGIAELCVEGSGDDSKIKQEAR